MTTQEPRATDAQKKKDARRKRKAILAGGVVLGLGAAMTLAAWTDNVFSKGSFQTGKFDLIGSQAQASTTVGDYSQYDTAGTAADLTTGSGGGIDFKMDSLNLTPGETVVAPFSIATTSDTTVNGRYWLKEATIDAGALVPFLSFAIVQSATCTAEDPATTAIEQTSLASPWKSGTFTAVNQVLPYTSERSQAVTPHDIALTKAFGNQSHLCIGVTLKDDEAAIKAATAAAITAGTAIRTTITWHFAGEALPLTN